MAILRLKTVPHAKVIAHRVATVLHVLSAASVLSAQKATSVRMTVQNHAQKVAQTNVVNVVNVVKAAIHAMSAGMTAAHAVTTLTKPH